jgi:hypothetical protein
MSDKLKRMAIATAALVALVAGGVAIAHAGGGDNRSLGASGAPGAGGNSDRCPRPPQGSEPVNLDPADFTTRIDNPYWPMTPGNRWVLREVDREGNEERVVVTVTNKTKTVAAGIKARVIRDVVTENGQPLEVTDDWYAQDECGNIWYLGEATTEYENGQPVSTHGSWEAGVDGAQAGIAVPAKPKVGLTYRQEYYAGEAEDAASVLSITEQAEVPFGHFTGVLLTRDYTPLDPKILEYKLYAKGVGPVLVLNVSGGGGGYEELVRFDKAG